MNYSYRPGSDVLSGRSERIKKNNLFYRLKVHEYFALYNDCKDNDKRHVAELIVHAVQVRGGRFLDSQGNMMPDGKAVKKTMKALKDLRKTHGRTAPQRLPPRLAKMTALAYKEAAEAAAAKLVELQQQREAYWHSFRAVEAEAQPYSRATGECAMVGLNHHHEHMQHSYQNQNHHDNWNWTETAANVTGDTNTTNASSMEETYDPYEPLPLELPSEANHQCSGFDGQTMTETTVDNLTFL